MKNSIRSLIAIAALLAFGVTAHAQQRHNVVKIMTDDQGVDSLRYMPKLKALLADKGMTFTNSFAQYPLCCPSRASWFSGQFAHNHGILGNTPLWSGGYAEWKPSEQNSLPVWMQNSGYNTIFLGKMLNGYQHEAYHIPPGWTTWRGFKTQDYHDWSMYGQNGVINQFTDYQTDRMATFAYNVLAKPQQEPYMFFVWPFAPHFSHLHPNSEAIPAARDLGTFNAVAMPKTPAFNTNHMTGKHPIIASFPQLDAATLETKWRRYIETLQAVDDMVETIVNELTANGQLDNTYIIYTSDNGNLQGDFKREGKILPYESSVKVPLIIRGPGIPEGVTRNDLVLNVDVTATILDLAGAPYGRVLDGRSMVPLFSLAPVAWRSAVLLTGIYDNLQEYDNQLTRWNAVRTKTRKYIVSSDGHEELYDIAADPYERFSVIRNGFVDPYYAGDLTALRALEDQLDSCAGTSCWVD